MTSSNEAKVSREYLTCLDGGGIHSWEERGLDNLPASLFPRARAQDGEVLCRTRRCVWCGLTEAKVYPRGSRWKVVGW